MAREETDALTQSHIVKRYTLGYIKYLIISVALSVSVYVQLMETTNNKVYLTMRGQR